MADTSMDAEEERICRYCFDGEDSGELISPCKCAGGQKYVHLACLRQWQRMVLVSQPTHPAFHDRDFRHHVCNVCTTEFNCPPPTRHELMTSFTGPEIAALINEGCIIAAHAAFSEELKRQIAALPLRLGAYRHWIHGVYLITSVTEEDGKETVEFTEEAHLNRFRELLDDCLSMTILSMEGKRYVVSAEGSLASVPQERLVEEFKKLSVPCSVTLASDKPLNCGDDLVVAVNLTRPISCPRPRELDRAMRETCKNYRGAAQVEITHYHGGPCDEEEFMCCLVLGGHGRGWTVCKDLKAGIELAYSRAAERYETQGGVCGGQTVRLQGLKAAPELNGEMGVALRFVEESGRWMVRLCNGEGKQLKPVNLESLEGSKGRLFAIWGDARWSRAQLLGEIAKGDWGLCKANVGDLFRAPSERWHGTEGRPAFAPLTVMSEDYMRNAQTQMNEARNRSQRNMEPSDTVEDQIESNTPEAMDYLLESLAVAMDQSDI